MGNVCCPHCGESLSVTCLRCGNVWTPRKLGSIPRICPKCNRTDWNDPQGKEIVRRGQYKVPVSEVEVEKREGLIYCGERILQPNSGVSGSCVVCNDMKTYLHKTMITRESGVMVDVLLCEVCYELVVDGRPPTEAEQQWLRDHGVGGKKMFRHRLEAGKVE